MESGENDEDEEDLDSELEAFDSLLLDIHNARPTSAEEDMLQLDQSNHLSHDGKHCYYRISPVGTEFVYVYGYHIDNAQEEPCDNPNTPKIEIAESADISAII
jgi:hypothetical protein